MMNIILKTILVSYKNFKHIFLTELITYFSKYTKINNYIIY